MLQGSIVQYSPSICSQTTNQSNRAFLESRKLSPINNSYKPRNATKSTSQGPTIASSLYKLPKSDRGSPSRPMELKDLLNPEASDNSSATGNQGQCHNTKSFDITPAPSATSDKMLPALPFVPLAEQLALPSLTTLNYLVPTDLTSQPFQQTLNITLQL